MFYLTTHSTHLIYGYMASDIIMIKTTHIVSEEIPCRHMGYSFLLTARAILYAPSNRQDSTYHGLCYTSCGVLAGTRNSSDDPSHHERTPLPRSYISLHVGVRFTPSSCLENKRLIFGISGTSISLNENILRIESIFCADIVKQTWTPPKWKVSWQ